MDIAAGKAELLGNLTLGVAVGEQPEGNLLLGGEAGEGGFEVELGKELLLLLVGQALLDLQLGIAEGRFALLDFLEVEVAKALAAAQRRIPSWDPDRLPLHLSPKTNGGPNPNGFEPPLLRPLRTGL